MITSTTEPRRSSSLARLFRVSVADYHRMGGTGILGPDLRTELIDGEIVEMPPIGHPHAGTVKLLANLMKETIGRDAIVAVQDPVWLNGHSEPMPDIALLRPRPDYYRNGHLGPADVLLLVEVADSSLANDREIKLPRYARAGIPEVWLVDLAGRRLAIHRQPAANGYSEIRAVDDRSAIALPLGPDVRRTIDLTALF
ncbi:Uma2 family endonuclease [Thiocapsa bogorovii]|uniref:Uma2 family endonuclease n=1 Tax=Thiocapsa bogorovii TaxID=521689 RepID=UPI001E493E74|nr:Uma2 family endonuclease [Thiocapsa bogorovii]UHD17463.1 Uma2 family endonuclease [Thiocapsa bogorovii]